MLRNKLIIKAINKVMAKLTGKGSQEENKENTINADTNPTKPLTSAEEKNLILNFLKEKNEGLWTSEADIEKAMDGKIHYYHVRQILPYLRAEKYIEHTTMQESYKLSIQGKEFIAKGGYTN